MFIGVLKSSAGMSSNNLLSHTDFLNLPNFKPAPNVNEARVKTPDVVKKRVIHLLHTCEHESPYETL